MILVDVAGGVTAHYSGPRLAERILEAAKAAGIEEITPAALGPMDEFHTGGLPATRQLAEFGELQPGMRVLDIGAGLGGPSRVLAAEFGCDVTGIDLTEEFVRSARILTERCGLSDRVRFQQGDALAMPFADESFDIAWTQHVVMNIRDRLGLYREAFRILKPGGRLLFFDILKGNGLEPDFPLPWANDQSISFLYNAEETKGFLSAAGFQELKWEDVTDSIVSAMRNQSAPPGRSPLTLAIVLGEDMRAKIAAVGRSAMDGRLAYVRGVFQRP